jgi:glutamate synthase domain-containing protein 1
MKDITIVQKILASRRQLIDPSSCSSSYKTEEEGGCGVTGFASSIPVGGKHIFEPSVQMHNRGNGKGGGIAAAGLCADDLGVAQKFLDDDYLLQVAYLDPAAREQVERECIQPFLKIDSVGRIPTVDDYRDIEGLETQPPDVWRYFVRVQKNVLADFIEKQGLQKLPQRKAEDEFIYQNSYRLNQRFYASLGEKKAFVLSHARDMMVLKIVGYAEKVAQYYKLENFKAHIWIAHQRYPTKGRVWHPGGAHPFIGMHEALVHNGDFANYHSVCEYLRQRNIYPQFLTDTEVSVLLFDLWNRVYGYPLEYIIEALAPTGEMDFDCLPPEKQKIYRAIQTAHIHGSPDGPWFFIIARHDPYTKRYQLMGITDTSMLRPQVFALQESEEVQIGLVCSEKQAIDATLHSLSEEDKRFSPIADKYWNARGGSHTDGGAFMFEFTKNGSSSAAAGFTCTDKFGKVISTAKEKKHLDRTIEVFSAPKKASVAAGLSKALNKRTAGEISEFFRKNIAQWDFNACGWCCKKIAEYGNTGDASREKAITVLTHLIDYRYPTGNKKRSSVLELIHRSLYELFASAPRQRARPP